MNLKKKKWGHQKKKWSWLIFRHKFNEITVENYHYCKSHNFLYNPREQKELLYNAKPCIYTDSRYIEAIHNYYGKCSIFWTRWKDQSLKKFKNIISEVRNAEGAEFKITSSYYHKTKSGKCISPYYLQKGSKKKFDPKYEINLPEYFQNFKDPKCAALVDRLRAEGFIVEMVDNSDFIKGMINTAVTYTGGEPIENEPIEEACVAYGYGKKIGFSNGDNPLFGYYNGRANILYDYYGCFDKWSRCEEIPKGTDIEEIIKILKLENESQTYW